MFWRRRADEGTLSRWSSRASFWQPRGGNATTILLDAAAAYKVNTDAIALKVKQEFTAKEKAKKLPQSTSKPTKKAA